MTPGLRSGERGSQQVVLAPHARDRLGDLCRRYATEVTVVADADLAATTTHVRDVTDVISAAGLRVEQLRIPGEHLGQLDSAHAIHDRLRHCRTGAFVALGGGSVIDAAKLARAAYAEPWLLDRSVWRRTAGLFESRAVESVAEPPFLVAAATRPGSAAEVTARVALAPDPEASRRLLYGANLVPTVAVADPHWSATLDQADWLESIVEVLFRVLGPFLVTRRSSRRVDRTTGAWIGELVATGMALAAQGGPSGEQRLRIAELSAATATGEHVHQWAPTMPAWWCIQNTACARTGLTKGNLTARVLPRLLDRVAAGEDALGDARRLDRLEAVVGDRQFRAAIDNLCETVRRTSPHPGEHSDDDLAAWADDVLTQWGRHTGVAALGPGGVRDILRAAGL